MSSSTNRRMKGGRKGKISNDFSNSASASASFIGSNFDILTLILVLLPSKSLLVFKSVSKHWLSIITDPQFVHRHFIQNPRVSVSGLFWCDALQLHRTYEYISLDGNTNSYVPFETLTFAKDKFRINIVQSCNGLLLCANRSCYNCYIFNPFTKQYKVLPPSQMALRNYRTLNLGSICLAFDPFKSPYYKVVSFWQKKNGDPNCYNYEIEIYDSETSSWRLSGIESCTPGTECINGSSNAGNAAVFWNGSLYFCSSNGSMAYFDIARELVGVVPLPSSVQSNTFKIAEYGGRFYLIGRDWVDVFSIFEMDSAESCWKFKGRVNWRRLNPYAGSPCGSAFLPCMDYVIYISEKDKEKEPTKVVLLTKECKVFSYDLKDMSYEKIYDLSARQKFRLNVHFHQYIESLACV